MRTLHTAATPKIDPAATQQPTYIPDTQEAEALFKEAKQRERRRRLIFASMLTALLAIAGGIIGFLAGSPPVIRATKPVGTLAPRINRFATTYPTGYPTVFQPSGVDALSPSHFLVYGTVPIGKARRATLLQTVDGGAHFSSVHVPPEPNWSNSYIANLATSPHSQPAVQFANGHVGYALESVGLVVEPQILYVTHDTGTTWHVQPSMGEIMSLQVTPHHVFAVLADCTRFSCTHWRFATQSPGADRWRIVPFAVSVPESGNIQMTVFGSGGWLFESGPSIHNVSIMRFDSSGAISTARVARTLTPPCTLAASSSTVLWASCTRSNANGSAEGGMLLRSTDAGSTFHQVSTLSANAFSVYPMTPTSALIVGGGGPWVTRATLGRSSLRRVIDLNQAASTSGPTHGLSFSVPTFMATSGPSTSFLVVFHEAGPSGQHNSAELYITRDGGNRWTRLR